MAVDRLGQRLGFWLAVHPGHRQRGAVLMSSPTRSRRAIGQVGILLGLGDHTTAVLGP